MLLEPFRPRFRLLAARSPVFRLRHAVPSPPVSRLRHSVPSMLVFRLRRADPWPPIFRPRRAVPWSPAYSLRHVVPPSRFFRSRGPAPHSPAPASRKVSLTGSRCRIRDLGHHDAMCPIPGSCGKGAFKGDADGGSLADFGVDHGDLTLVILLDDTSRERQSESPAAGFGGESGLEECVSSCFWGFPFRYPSHRS